MFSTLILTYPHSPSWHKQLLLGPAAATEVGCLPRKLRRQNLRFWNLKFQTRLFRHLQTNPIQYNTWQSSNINQQSSNNQLASTKQWGQICKQFKHHKTTHFYQISSQENLNKCFRIKPNPWNPQTSPCYQISWREKPPIPGFVEVSL